MSASLLDLALMLLYHFPDGSDVMSLWLRVAGVLDFSSFLYASLSVEDLHGWLFRHTDALCRLDSLVQSCLGLLKNRFVMQPEKTLSMSYL